MEHGRGDDTDTLDVFGRWYGAHESRDVDGLAAVLADDVTVYSLFRRAPVRGRVAAIAHFVAVNAAFGEMAMRLTGPRFAVGGRVLVEVEFTGTFVGELAWNGQTNHGSGQHFCVPGVAAIAVDNGKVRSVRTLYDRDDWLQQISVLPSGGDPCELDALEEVRK